MIAMSRDEEEYPQPPWLSRSCSGRSRQDLMERGCVDMMKWPNPPSLWSSHPAPGCPGVTAVPTPPRTHGES